MAAATRKRSGERKKQPLEYSLLYTATLCLIAAGAVMVYSASSATALLNGSGDPSYYLKRYVVFAVIGLAVMHAVSRRGLSALRNVTPVLLAAGFVLCLAVMVPHIGVTVNGATRWLAVGPVQFQPSELLKIALILYSAQLLAARPSRLKSIGALCKPLLLVVGAACLILLKQPDMGTALVVCFSIGALLVAAGVQRRHLGIIVLVLLGLALVFAIAEPYRRARLMSFVDPWKDAGGAGFQSVQAMIAIGSGGMFGVGLGESVQKIFYLPEAHTDMILAIVGEELGVVGISGVASLFVVVGWAGLRAAKAAKDRYAKLLAAGITGLILSQACLNFFAVMGMAPLTGVPLPFISYGSSNLIVVLAGAGILLNVASGGRAASSKSRKRPSGQRSDQRRRRPARAARAA